MKASRFSLYTIASAFLLIFTVQMVFPVDLHSTVEQYKQRFGLTALNMACKYANYRVIVGLLQEDGEPDQFKLQQIIQMLKTKQLYDLRSLFIALQKNTISLAELIQCVGVLKEQPEVRDTHGKVLPLVRICNGNTNALDFVLFDELSLELQKKICRILWLNERKFIQKKFC